MMAPLCFGSPIPNVLIYIRGLNLWVCVYNICIGTPQRYGGFGSRPPQYCNEVSQMNVLVSQYI